MARREKSVSRRRVIPILVVTWRYLDAEIGRPCLCLCYLALPGGRPQVTKSPVCCCRPLSRQYQTSALGSERNRCGCWGNRPDRTRQERTHAVIVEHDVDD